MIFTQYPNDFWHKINIDHFNPYKVFLAIATNIHVLLIVVHIQSTHSVVMASGGTEELERPASFKSPVWEHFGFPVKYNDEGKRLVDKTVTVCRHCGTRKPYDSGNTWPRI